MKLDKILLMKCKTFNYDETIIFDDKIIENTSLVKKVSPAKIKGSVKYNHDGDFVHVNIFIETSLTLMSRFDLKPYKQEIKILLDRIYTFDKNNKTYDILATQYLNLSAEIYNEIMFKIPIEKNKKSVKIGKQGDNWSLISESDLLNQVSEEQFDPRFAELRKFIKKDKVK